MSVIVKLTKLNELVLRGLLSNRYFLMKVIGVVIKHLKNEIYI